MEESKIGFSISNTEKVTNKKLEITFKPDSSAQRFEYRKIKDGIKDEFISVDGNESITIFLNDSGKYIIEVNTYDIYNSAKTFKSGEYNLDLDAPTINLKDNIINMPLGSILNVEKGVSAKDNQDGDITARIKSNINELDLTKIGKYKLQYKVEDQAGNVATKEVLINVTKNQMNSLLSMQFLMLAALLSLVFMLIRYRKNYDLINRVTKYSIEPLEDNSVSIFDKITEKYKVFIKKLSSYLKKSEFITKYSLRYKKYINTSNAMFDSEIDFVSNKLVTAITLTLIAIFSETLQLKVLNFYEFLIPFILGFFLLDIIYISKYKLYREKIENDLLQAIIIMNNAFKSGRSISQAILLVANEMDGPIADEFKKMHLEISFGLGVEVVFKRFSDRIKLEEVSYLTASLTILNKAGGNIINVFTSIEKSLFNKKKLKLELRSLTGSSKVIFYALLALPVLFALVISLVNPGYFKPLYTTTIGGIIVTLMLVIYVVYFFAAKALMKVRM